MSKLVEPVSTANSSYRAPEEKGQPEAALPKWQLQRASWSDGHTVQLVDGRWRAVATPQIEAQKLDHLIPFVRLER